MKTFVDVERMRGVLRVFSKECPGAAGRKEFERFAEKRLVSRCAHDPALRKAVDQKRRDPHLIEVFRPEFMTAIRSTGPVQQHHGGDLPTHASRDAQLTTDCYGFSAAIAREELLVSQCERGNRAQLGTRGQIIDAWFG